MKVTVTGGSGFVGCHLLPRLLAAGHDPRNLDISPSSTHTGLTRIGDIRDLQACVSAMRGSDAIIHLAALYRDDVRPRELYYEVNVDGTRNIVLAAETCGITKIIFTSSFSVYGLDNAGRTEDRELDPVNDYGRSKMAAEKILREWQSRDPVRSLQIVRPSVIFGEGNRGNVWTLVNQIANGRFALVGRGTNRKSVAYVGNVVEFLLLLLERQGSPTGLYNYADKPDMSVSEIVELAASTLGKPVKRIPIPGGVAMLVGYAGDAFATLIGRPAVLSSERIRKFLADTRLPTERVRELGFEAPFELKSAFVRTIQSEFLSSEKRDRKTA
jgi:nucleoside-diphosphate-sugar epimerase